MENLHTPPKKQVYYQEIYLKKQLKKNTFT